MRGFANGVSKNDFGFFSLSWPEKIGHEKTVSSIRSCIGKEKNKVHKIVPIFFSRPGRQIKKPAREARFAFPDSLVCAGANAGSSSLPSPDNNRLAVVDGLRYFFASSAVYNRCDSRHSVRTETDAGVIAVGPIPGRSGYCLTLPFLRLKPRRFHAGHPIFQFCRHG